jgi:Ca2+-binding EF-hand superfamily protein
MDRRAELVKKVSALVGRYYRNDWTAAFAAYATDGKVTSDGLVKLLRDAEVGNMVTRNAWARGVLDALDADRDDAISWDEFWKVFRENH